MSYSDINTPLVINKISEEALQEQSDNKTLAPNQLWMTPSSNEDIKVVTEDGKFIQPTGNFSFYKGDPAKADELTDSDMVYKVSEEGVTIQNKLHLHYNEKTNSLEFKFM